MLCIHRITFSISNHYVVIVKFQSFSEGKNPFSLAAAVFMQSNGGPLYGINSNLNWQLQFT